MPAKQPQAQPTEATQLTIVGACARVRIPNNSALRQAVEATRGQRALVTLIMRDGAPLTPDLIAPLHAVLQSRGRVEELDLWLHTLGGQTEVPWQIVSLVREFCKKFAAIVPVGARSAGTHVALGADSLVLGPLSTLGPVDPTTKHPLMPRDPGGEVIPVSVEDLKHCIRFIASQLKAQEAGDERLRYSPSDMTTIVGHLFQHIDPLAVGAVERAYELSRMITRRVLETHLDPTQERDKIDRIVDKIGGGYYSHHFPITRRDVIRDLGLVVEDVANDFWHAIDAAFAHYSAAFDHTFFVNTPDKHGIAFIILGFIECGDSRRVLVQATMSKQGATGGQVVQRWVPVRQDQPTGALPFDVQL